jgi:hypothetical protein
MRYFIVMALSFLGWNKITAQDKSIFIHFNTSVYQSYYKAPPTLDVTWANLGAGVSYFYSLNEKVGLRGMYRLNTMSWKDSSMVGRDNNGNALYEINPVAREYNSMFTAAIHFKPNPKFYLETGFTLMWHMYTGVKIQSMDATGKSTEGYVPVQYLNKIEPYIPVGLYYKSEKFMIGTRFDFGLLNRYRGTNDFQWRAGIFSLEAGFKIK